MEQTITAEQYLDMPIPMPFVVLGLVVLGLTYLLPKLQGWSGYRRMKLYSMIFFITGFSVLGMGFGDIHGAEKGISWFAPQIRGLFIAGGIAITIVGVVFFVRHADNFE